VLPAAKVTDGAVLNTLSPRGTLTVSKQGNTVELVFPEVELNPAAETAAERAEEETEHKAHKHPAGTDTADVVATNLTFDGPFVPGKSTYVIHAIDEVMIPASAAAAARALIKPAAGAAAKPAAGAAAKPAATAAMRPAAAAGGRKLL
jgi:hypothetical protein